MEDKMKIQEVIVVEGKDDTKRIKMAVNADTIETRGSAISDETLDQIAELQEKRGVIVFTDPDYSGEKIRKTIREAVPGVKHAFLKRKDAVPDHQGSLGVEHASPEVIREALISREMLAAKGLINGPAAKKRRELLGEILNIGYTNGKQLYKQLRLFEITPGDFEDAMQKVEQQMENGDQHEK